MANEFTVTVYDYDANEIRTEKYNSETDALTAARRIADYETVNGLPLSTAVHANGNDIPLAQFPLCPGV